MKYRKYDEKIIVNPDDVIRTAVTGPNYLHEITTRNYTRIREVTPIWGYLSERLGQKKAHQFLQTLNDLDAKGLL